MRRIIKRCKFCNNKISRKNTQFMCNSCRVIFKNGYDNGYLKASRLREVKDDKKSYVTNMSFLPGIDGIKAN